MISLKRPFLLQTASYFTLVAASVFFGYNQFAFPEKNWLLVSSLLFSFALWINLHKIGRKFLFLLSLSSFLFVFLAGIAAQQPLIWSIFYLFLITIICYFICHPAHACSMRFSAFKKTDNLKNSVSGTTNNEMTTPYFTRHLVYAIYIITLFSLFFPTKDLTETITRASLIFASFMIGWFWLIVFALKFPRQEFNFQYQLFFQQIMLLNQELFSCFLQPSYQDNVYKYERRLHFSKHRIWHILANIGELTRENPVLLNTVNQLNSLFLLLLSYGQLRHRVTDYHIFSVCRTDMEALLTAINKIFAKKMMRVSQTAEELLMLSHAIKQLEATNQNVLQVTCREPLVFVLFIFDLKKLCQQLEML